MDKVGPLSEEDFAILNAKAHLQPTFLEHIKLVNATAKAYAEEHKEEKKEAFAFQLKVDREYFEKLEAGCQADMFKMGLVK